MKLVKRQVQGCMKAMGSTLSLLFRCTSPPVKQERTKDTKSKMKFDAAVQEAEMYMNREEEQQVVDIPSDSTQQGGKKITQSVKV